MTMDAASSSMTPEQKYNTVVDFVGARVEVIPLFSSVVPGFVNKVPVLFQVITGQNSASQRDPFSLAVVLDVSGSMQGNRLENCKLAILQLIESTQDHDKLSLVIYSTDATVIFENVRCGDEGARQRMRQAVNMVCADGATNLYAGLRKGYELLHGDISSNKHIFILSDGLVNEGYPSSPAGILAAVEEWEEKIPILSYGIGNDFNEKLMSPLGQVHKGSHYFYITDAASIERLMARGIRALTCAVARNVELSIAPLTNGIHFPDNLIDGVHFQLVREKSVIQYVVDVELRPEMPAADAPSFIDQGYEVVRPTLVTQPLPLSFAWSVGGFPMLENCSGQVDFQVTMDRSFRKSESPEVRTFLDVKRGCDLRRSAATSPDGRRLCEQALQLFRGRVAHDRFGFAEEWATKTKALLEDGSLWCGDGASGGAAKHLGVSYDRRTAVEEEEEEEEMDFDLFG
jgi:hypothetical protein